MSGGHTSANDVDVDLGRLFASLREYWLRILLFTLAITALVFAWALFSTPLYRAETRILIETRESVYTRPENAGGDERPILDDSGVSSQVEVVASSDILAKVARDLDLARREEFQDRLSPLGRLMVMVGLRSNPADVAPTQRVLQIFREKLDIYRVKDSRVITIQFSSEDPELAAKVPNAIAEAYIAVQRDAKLQSNEDATGWLEPEIADLRERVKAAEARVAEFRSQSDLLLGQNNSVLATQQLSELSSELSRVRAARAAAEAKAEAVRAAIEEGAPVETMPDVLSSSLIQSLRTQQVELQAQIAQLSATYLPNHPRIKALNSQLEDLAVQIRAEAQKVLDGLDTEAQTARFRERELVADLNKLKVESARAGEEQVELRALEREATAQRQLLESYLTRYREASSRREHNYLPADARVFSRALVPAEPYFPKVLPMTLAAFAASLLLSAIFVLLRELFSGRAMRPAPRAIDPIRQVAMPVPQTIAIRQEDEQNLRPEPETSAYGEIGIATAAQVLISGGMSRAIFVSPEGDDAAAAAVLVAREVADAGLRVLLLDLTTSSAASRPMLESPSYTGITNLLASEAQFADIIHGDLYSDCHVIPAGTADPERAMRAADRLPIIMDSLAAAYDVVLVECGPVDPAEIERLVTGDAIVMVAMLDPEEGSAAQTLRDLKAFGYGEAVLVTPVGYEPPAPEDRRSSAA